MSRGFQLTLALAGLCIQCLAAGAFTIHADTLDLGALHFHDPSISSGPGPGNANPQEAVLRTDSTPVIPEIEEAWEATPPRASASPRAANWPANIFPVEVEQLTGDPSRLERLGLGVHQRLGQWIRLSGEVSAGEGSIGAQFGGSCHLNDRVQLYTNSGAGATPVAGVAPGLNGTLTSGARWRVSEKAGVFGEERLKLTDSQRGGTHAIGLDLRSAPHWSWRTTLEMGELSEPAAGKRQQRAGGLSVGYARKGIRYGGNVELHVEEGEGPARSEVWNARNDFEFQMADGWRLLGRLNAFLCSSREDRSLEGTRIEYWTELARGQSGRDTFNVLTQYTFSLDSARDWQTDLQVGFFGSVHEAVRVGIGYNFDDFSSGTTEPPSDGQGWFLQIAGTF